MNLVFLKNDAHELIHSNGKIIASFVCDDVAVNQIFLVDTDGIDGQVISQDKKIVDTTGYQLVPIKELSLPLVVDLIRLVNGVKFNVKATIKSYIDHPLSIVAKLSTRIVVKNYNMTLKIYDMYNSEEPILPSSDYKLYNKLIKISTPVDILTIAKSSFDHSYLLECTDFQSRLLDIYRATCEEQGHFEAEYELSDWIREHPITTVIGMIAGHSKITFTQFFKSCESSSNIDLSNETINSINHIFHFYDMDEYSISKIISLMVRFGIKLDAVCLVPFFERLTNYSSMYKKNFKLMLLLRFISLEYSSIDNVYIEAVQRKNSEYCDNVVNDFIRSFGVYSNPSRLYVRFICNVGNLRIALKVLKYYGNISGKNTRNIIRFAANMRINNFIFIRGGLNVGKVKASKRCESVINSDNLFSYILSYLVGDELSIRIAKNEFDSMFFDLFK